MTKTAAPSAPLGEMSVVPAESGLGAGSAANETTLIGTMLDTRAEMLDAIVSMDQILASTAAARAVLIDQSRQWSEITSAVVTDGRTSGSSGASSPLRSSGDAMMAHRAFVSEIATALRIPERSAESLVGESEILVRDLPATMHALRNGEVSYRHAQKMIDHVSSIPEADQHDFENDALPYAKRLTVPQFDARARALRERKHRDSIAKRKAKAVTDRSITVEPDRDGMAWLTAHLPAEQAVAIYNRVTDAALAAQASARQQTGSAGQSGSVGQSGSAGQTGRDGQSGSADDRTLTQLRADAFSTLLLRGVTESSSEEDFYSNIALRPVECNESIVPRVMVTVPVLTLLGHSDEPGELEGHGPIDPDTARRLSAHAPSFMRILTHPETGIVLSVGRDKYRPPADLRTWLRVRDGTCRFPGCRSAARRCDVDHTTDWHGGGDTAHDNLAHLCPKHHRMKHDTPWTVEQSGGGTLTWTSPLKRTYQTEPAVQLDGAPPRADPDT
jgi:hypothetical protein